MIPVRRIFGFTAVRAWLVSVGLLILSGLGVAAGEANPGPFTAAPKRFTVGVGGHPDTGLPLWSDISAQMATLHDRGLQTYRFGLQFGRRENLESDLQQLINLGASYGITLHPTLVVPFTYGDTTDGGRYPDNAVGYEQQGYDRVHGLVMKYAHQIHDWELQNEINYKPGVRVSGSTGFKIEDFDTEMGRKWAAVLRGMSRAVHDAAAKTGQPLRTVVNFGYPCFGLIPFFLSQGVQIDKVAFHYYLARYDNPHAFYGISLFEQLAQFKRPIIINELNSYEVYFPLKGKPYDDIQALKSMKRHLEYVTQQTVANIEGLEIYELYDEPGRDAAESNFGIMRDAVTPKKQMFLAALYACGNVSDAEVQQLIADAVLTADELKVIRGRCTR